MTHLNTKVLRFESLPSTNTELSRLASEGAEEGVSVVADEQTAGRGRLQRAWSSPKGAGLYFSILLRPAMPQEHWPLITFMAALATGDALNEAAGGRSVRPYSPLCCERSHAGIRCCTRLTGVKKSSLHGAIDLLTRPEGSFR